MYASLIPLLSYPTPAMPAAAAACHAAIGAGHEQASAWLRAFAEGAALRSQQELEEEYTAAFDLDPGCALDLGWHLFGDDRRRGAFLAKLQGEMDRAGVAPGQQLPDHLTHVLALLERMDETAADRFAVSCVIPAVRQIVVALEQRNSLYLPCYRALSALLTTRHAAKGETHARHGS